MRNERDVGARRLGNQNTLETNEITRFPLETHVALEKMGYIIYRTSGMSDKDIRKLVGAEKTRTLWPWPRSRSYAYENLPSMRGEIAYRESKVFLPKSNIKTFREQNEMIEQFSKELQKEISGVEAVLGNVGDYIGLMGHLTESARLGINVFNGETSFIITRTKVERLKGNSELVGVCSKRFPPGRPIRLYSPDKRNDCWVAPLVVPVKYELS